MSYPKPLSKKTIDKKLSTWNPKKADLLHQYYQALANLYGVISLEQAWSVLKTYKTDLTRKEFYEFSEIVRREEHDYRVYEVDEVYSEEKRELKERIIIHTKLISEGYGGMMKVYAVQEAQNDYNIFVPEDLLYYTKMRMPQEWNELKTFIGNLKTKQGMKLSKYACLTQYDEINLSYYKSESKKSKIRAEAERPQANRIMDRLFLELMLGNSAELLSLTVKWLEDVGVSCTERETEKMVQLVPSVANNTHLWHNFGWTPTDLHRRMGNQMPKTVVLGPGYQKAFAEGTLNREEIIQKFREMGIEVEE